MQAIAAKHGVHPTQVNLWKKDVSERLPELFTRQVGVNALAAQAREKKLYEEIGRLKMQLDWLKKTWPVWGLRGAAA